LNRFRGFGVSLALSGTVLTIVTYLLLGLVPLVALWIAFTILGLSMFLTPEEALVKADLLAVIEDFLSNLSALFEAFGASSHAAYVCYDGGVYVFVSEEPLSTFPDSPPKSLVTAIGSSRVFVLRSPLSSIVGGLEGEFSSSSYHVIVELLEVADGVECSEQGDTLSCLVRKPYISSPGRLERTVGSIYGMCLASIASKAYGRPVTLVREEASKRGRLIVLRRM